MLTKEYRPNRIDRWAVVTSVFFGVATALAIGFLLLLAAGAVLPLFSSSGPGGSVGPVVHSGSALRTAMWMTGAILAAFALLCWRASRYESYLEQREKMSTDHVISNWSLTTLQSAGVPRDILDCLRSQLAEAQKWDSEIKKIGGDEWLEKLKLRLGNDRVAEYETMILKYTRRVEGTE